MILELEIPVGMEAEVPLHSIGGKYVINGRHFIPVADKSSRVSLKSGKFRITYDLV